jgi:hypothetical protein
MTDTPAPDPLSHAEIMNSLSSIRRVEVSVSRTRALLVDSALAAGIPRSEVARLLGVPPDDLPVLPAALIVADGHEARA